MVVRLYPLKENAWLPEKNKFSVVLSIFFSKKKYRDCKLFILSNL